MAATWGSWSLSPRPRPFHRVPPPLSTFFHFAEEEPGLSRLDKFCLSPVGPKQSSGPGPKHSRLQTDRWPFHQQPGKHGAPPRSSASQKHLTWTENRESLLERDASPGLPSPFIFLPTPEKKVPLSRATPRRFGHEVRATWLGSDAKAIKVVNRLSHGERSEDEVDKDISSLFLFSRGLPQASPDTLG